MSTKHNILILGASYGSLLGTKLLMAGHDVTLICLPEEADKINTEGVIVRMPVRGRDGLVEIRSKDLPGTVRAAGTTDVDPSDYDLIGLAMQEPQYKSPGVRELLQKVATCGRPAMSIMNMPPLPFMRRLPGIDATAIRPCYADATVWDAFDPGLVTLCSPDPQAFRPPEEPPNVLQVSLPTNFKVARYDNDAHTAILKRLADDIEAARFTVDGEAIEIPVKLKLHDSLYVPLAKWAMLLTGNYRCVQPEAMRAIRDAVHSDLETSREVYEWVKSVCVAIGAAPEDLVPFEKYANAAQGLVKPSSAARALDNGAPNIERVDMLVKIIAASKDMEHPVVTETVGLVDSWLQRNRS